MLLNQIWFPHPMPLTLKTYLRPQSTAEESIKRCSSVCYPRYWKKREKREGRKLNFKKRWWLYSVLDWSDRDNNNKTKEHDCRSVRHHLVTNLKCKKSVIHGTSSMGRFCKKRQKRSYNIQKTLWQASKEDKQKKTTTKQNKTRPDKTK